MAGEEDRLSALGDDILRQILYFTPAKEAASTSALSRRWGSLWRSTGAVNLAVHIPDDGSHNYYNNYDIQTRQELEVAFFSHRDAFVRSAEAALAAATVRLSRITFHMQADHWNAFRSFLHRTKDPHVMCDVIGALLSHPAARRLDELRLTAHDFSVEFYIGSEMDHGQGAYAVGSLPSSETLRVVELTRCRELTLPEPVAFPRLAKLLLQSCVMDAPNLQSLIDAAPELTTVHLDSIIFSTFDDHAFLQHHAVNTKVVPVPCLRLRCLAATTLVLALCSLEVKSHRIDSWDIEIEAPRLRSFRYKGRARRFLLGAPAPQIVHVDLHFLHDNNKDNDHQSVDTTRRVFWQLVHNFSKAKIFKIKVKHLEHIAAIGKEKRTEHLCLLPNVERLELEGVHDPASKKAAVAIANLLRCCPALRDLQLKLSTVASESEKDTRYVQSVVERQDRLDYEKSLDHFMHRRSSKPMIPLNNDQYDEVSDIPGLRGRSFTCLHTSLRRVGLQFRLDKSNCFGVRLIRFFAENAMVLEEIALDSSTRRLLEHMNLNIERWIIAPNSFKASLKCKNIIESSWEFSRCPKGTTDTATDLKTSTSSFTVIPLQR